MHWIITKDLINTGVDDVLRVGKKCAPRTWIADYRAGTDLDRKNMLEQFKATMNFEFRLYDDDGELYYEGLCKDLDMADADHAFAPLDWATNDVGATRLDYRKLGTNDEWKTL